MGRYVLAIDQGTTSSRAMLFGEDFSVAATAQEEFPQHYPGSGRVEHDPRLERLRLGLQILLDDSGGRAQRIQRIFSREYSPEWRNTEPAMRRASARSRGGNAPDANSLASASSRERCSRRTAPMSRTAASRG